LKKIDALRMYDMVLNEQSDTLFAVSNGQVVKFEIV